MAKKPAAKSKPKGGGKPAKDRAKKAASASKGTKPVKANAVENDAERARKVISANALKDLAKRVRSLLEDASSSSSSAGSAISDAVKKQSLNAPAFRIILRMMNTGGRDPNKLRVLLDDLDYYRDVFKLDNLAGDSLLAPREGAQEDEVEVDEPSEPTGDSVVTFPSENRLAG